MMSLAKTRGGSGWKLRNAAARRTRETVMVNMVLNVHRNHKVYQVRDGEKVGKGVRRWGKRDIIYLSLHCHHQNDRLLH